MEAFLTYITERCGDPEAANVALQKLTLLRQGEYQYFRDYLQEFEILQVRAEDGQVWPDVIKINYLRQTLCRELQNRLVSVPNQPLGDYTQYVNLVADVASRLEALPEREHARRTRITAQKSHLSSGVGDVPRPGFSSTSTP